MNQKKPKNSLPFFSGSSSSGKKKLFNQKSGKPPRKNSPAGAKRDFGDDEGREKSPSSGSFKSKRQAPRENSSSGKFEPRDKGVRSKRPSAGGESTFRPRSTSSSFKPRKTSFEEGGRGFKKSLPRRFDDTSSGERTNRRKVTKDGFEGETNKRSFSGNTPRDFQNKSDKSGKSFRARKFDDDVQSEDKSYQTPRNSPSSGSFRTKYSRDSSDSKHRTVRENSNEIKGKRPRKVYAEGPKKTVAEEIRLNKFIANSGVCSRREADTLIISGVVTVNGITITELGHKIKSHDIVHCGGDLITNEKKVYLLLNKPKDYITTVTDPGKRKTVMELVSDACKERIYPVGRLDRNTTGLLLFTNDGELTKKLTHPRYGIEKIYHVELNMPLAKMDLDAIRKGVTLDDGLVQVDEINYVEFASSKKEVGIKLHSGKNRVVRRIFESLGYKVLKLDRVVFAGLTKKDLSRGRWRFLSGAEVSKLYAQG